MDKLAQQEAEAAAAAAAAKQSSQNDKGSGGDSGGRPHGKLGGGLNIVGQLASGTTPEHRPDHRHRIYAFDSAVDSMADDATTHHPAKERADLLSAYLFNAYRDAAPVSPTPLPWAPRQQVAAEAPLVALLAHYTDPRTRQPISPTRAKARRRVRKPDRARDPRRRPAITPIRTSSRRSITTDAARHSSPKRR